MTRRKFLNVIRNAVVAEGLFPLLGPMAGREPNVAKTRQLVMPTYSFYWIAFAPTRPAAMTLATLVEGPFEGGSQWVYRPTIRTLSPGVLHDDPA